MRTIQNYGGGELLDTFFVFDSEEEREDYFKRGEKAITESQNKSLADLRSAYMRNSVAAQVVRNNAGRQKAKEVFGSINDGYKEQVKKIHDLHARARGNLRRARETSLLEADLQKVPAPG